MTTIQVTTEFTVTATTDIELPDGKTWDDVADWGVSQGTIRFEWKDGSEWSSELNDVDPDQLGEMKHSMKQPENTEIRSASEEFLDRQ